MNGAPFDTEIREHNGNVIATLHGEIDSSNAATIQRSLAGQATGRRLVLDLSQVHYLDSAGIAAIATLHQASDLYLIVPSDSLIHRTLMITGIGKLIPITERIEDLPPSQTNQPPHD